VAKVSVGSVMQSGQQFITLVTAEAPLEVEANIFGRDQAAEDEARKELGGHIRVGRIGGSW
jgi:hypothetical protein